MAIWPTLLRNALAATIGADATIRTLCGRTTGCIVTWGHLASAQRPVIAFQVASMRELDDVTDAHEALVLVSCIGTNANGLAVAEALAQRVRELVGTTSVSGPSLFAGVDGTPDQQTIDDADLVPEGEARVDLTLRYHVDGALTP